jgi:hypothetical protein
MLMKKAGEYSTGILDYFFRGKLETTMVPNSSGGYNLTIKNVSGQDFHGGDFFLYWDDASGNRTGLLNPGNSTDGNFIPGWSGTLTILNNGTVSASFKPPTSAVTSYTLVYKGTIGASTGAQHDEVDEGIAIAAKTFSPFLYWTMEETSGNRIDSMKGISLTPHLHGGTVTTTQGKPGLGNALHLISPDITSPPDVSSVELPELGYDGGAISLCGWIQIDSGTPEIFIRFFNSSHIASGSFEVGLNSDQTEFRAALYAGTSISVGASVTVSPGDWLFFVASYDSPSGRLTLQVNDELPIVGSGQLFFSARPTGEFVIRCYSDDFDPVEATVDEISIFNRKLDPAQAAYLWNNGAGRTWPITLP